MPELQNFLPRSDRPAVLVADDDEFIGQLVRMTLEEAGFFVLTASDGEQALKLSRSFPGVIHVLVSDILMPRMDGLALREQILRDRPGIRVLLMSGQTDERCGDAAVLPKPFTLDVLKERVRELLGIAARDDWKASGR